MQAHVGHLNYIQQGSHPEISWALKIASKFTTVFGENQIRWVKHIVRYLKGAKLLGITLRRVPETMHWQLQIYTDASHAGDPDTRRSISGCVIKLQGATIFWKASFQKIVSHSSTESELMSLDTGATTGQYMMWIVQAMGATPRMPIEIFVDNTSTIDISTNPIQPGRNLHVHARYFYIRDCVIDGTYVIRHVGTHNQISDILVTYKDYPNFAKLLNLLLGVAYLKEEGGEFGWVVVFL